MAEDPYAPVEGVSLEQYTEAAVAMHADPSPEAMEAAAVAHGIPAGRHLAIGEEWNRRIIQHPEMVQRYHELYQAAMHKAGIVAPEITLEQYADILRRQGAGEPQQEVLASFGLTLQTFALVSQGWIDKMATDPSLAMKLGQLMSTAGPPTPPREIPMV
jgi:hypothetical protein